MTRSTMLGSSPGFVALAAALLVAGCATAPPAGQYVPSPDGTVISYHRVSNGSFGANDGPVVWTMGPGTWQGKPVMKLSSTNAGSTLYDLNVHRMLAQLNNAGQPTLSFEPPLGYDWPLEVGKAWTARHTMTVHAGPRQVPLEVRYRVEALEDVTVPGGTFKAFRVVSTDSMGEVQTVWSAPSLGIATVKRVLDRPASHPAGAGHLEGVLTARSLPK